MPMKGESERVAHKNMRSFNGEPLCAVMVDKLAQSDNISRIVINTDSREISSFLQGRHDKICIVERPQHLCGHDISMNKIIGYDLEKCDADFFLQTHSTNPLLRLETINDAIEKFSHVSGQYDSLFSVTKFQTRFYNAEGKALNHNPDELIKTQDLPALYEENSCIYLFSRASYNKNGKRIGTSPFLYEIDQMEAIDIDIEEEFILAEKLHQIL